jgi:hypothetical protein
MVIQVMQTGPDKSGFKIGEPTCLDDNRGSRGLLRPIPR